MQNGMSIMACDADDIPSAYAGHVFQWLPRSAVYIGSGEACLEGQ